MTYTVYADLFFLENLIMNYVIISAAALFTKKLFNAAPSPFSRLAGALVGAAYALSLVLLPKAPAGVLGSWFGKAVLSLIIVYIVYRPQKLVLMLKELAVFCLTGFIFAGTSLGVTFLGVPFTVTRNGIMISDLPSGVTNIFLTVGIGYISVSILINSLRRVCDKVQDTYVSLYIEFDGQGLWIPALIDTGNELRDPLTGTPVIIVESSAVKSILCPELTEMPFSEETILGGNTNLSPDWARRFRVIPFSSLGCENGLLPGFKADNIKVKGVCESPHNRRSAIICLCDRALSEDKKYSALLSPELVA